MRKVYSEDIMNDKFLFGVILGMLGGSLIVANSVKARQTVKNGQKQVLDKAEDLIKTGKKNSSK